MKRFSIKVAGKKWLARLSLVLGAVVAVAASLAIYVHVDGIPRYAPPHVPDLHVEATPARLSRGKQLVTLTCAGCHENDQTHKLTGKHMGDMPSEFGPVYSRNITKHPEKGIGSMSDGELLVLLRTGLKKDGQYLPPWMIKMPLLSDEDLYSIIAFMRSDDPMVAASDASPGGVSQPSFLAKALAHTVIKPLPYPSGPIAAPPRSDKVAYGRYMTIALDCYGCHSPDPTKVDHMAPESTPGYMTGGGKFIGPQGELLSANLTPDLETGIGNWSEADFIRAVKKGFRPDGHVLHYPMEPRPALSDEEAAAIYAYLRTLAPVKKVIDRKLGAPALAAGASDGQRLYTTYGCNACHGERGVGLGGNADLRRANEHFPTDEALRAWIEDAPSIRPDTKMPPWKGTTREEDYGPLMSHVRKLASPDGRHAGL